VPGNILTDPWPSLTSRSLARPSRPAFPVLYGPAMSLAPGEGTVEIAPSGVVPRLVARSPLHLLHPRNHGHAAWVMVASFGGGLVDGDNLRLDVKVHPGAVAYLSTQSSTKVYRGTASQHIEATVADGACLVSAPDPVVCFAGASFTQRQRVHLAPTASLVWLDSLSAGRVEHGERWQFTRFESHLTLERDGRPLATDALVLDPAHGALTERFGRWNALATLFAVGPLAAPLRALWLAPPPRLVKSAPSLVAPSPLGEDAAVARVAAISVQALLAALRPLLSPIPALLGDDPFARKW
jgi:urease accessory protein